MNHRNPSLEVAPTTLTQRPRLTQKIYTPVTYLQFQIQVCFLANSVPLSRHGNLHPKMFFLLCIFFPLTVNFGQWPWPLNFERELPCQTCTSTVISFEIYCQVSHTHTGQNALSRTLQWSITVPSCRIQT